MPFLSFTRIGTGPVAPLDIVTFELKTSSDYPEFFGIGFDLTYNADHLRYIDTDFIDVLEDFEIDNGAPADASGETTLEDIQGGTFPATLTGEQTVAEITFEAMAASDETSVSIDPIPDFLLFKGDVKPSISAPAPVTLAVNVPPEAMNDTATVAEDNSITIDVLANDSNPGGADPTIDSVGTATNGTVNIVNGKIVYNPEENFNGDDSFTYTIVDAFGVTAEATVDVNVTAVNDDPFADDDEGFLDKNDSVRVSVLVNDSDVDGDFLSVESITEGAGNGTVSIVGSEIEYTPVTDFVGTDSFTYTVTDGNGGSDSATVNITVNETNVDPVGGNDTATVDEDGSVSIDVLDNDTDGDNDDLSIGNFTQASNGSVTQTGDNLVYTPNANFNGSDSFTYQVDDGKGGTNLADVNLTVTPVNDEPVAVDDSASVNQDGSVEIDVLDNDSDVDGDTITLAAGGLVASNGTVAVTAGG
ncbi:MAG: tandem-95 repeat protein, partial [Acidobacteria bacterium]|nr:tandem-95 repeat protein [Acidobacteriota bacterium]